MRRRVRRRTGGERAAGGLLVALVRQLEPLERRRRAGLDEHAPGGGRAAVLEGEERRARLGGERPGHVAQPVERLVDDAVVVRVERRAGAAVGEAPHVHGAA
jgi:hypothetical protein